MSFPRPLSLLMTSVILVLSLATCKKEEPAPVKVSSITISQQSIQLKVGETKTLTATVSPNNATDKTVIWTTSDASVATVKDGVVTAVKVGSATITAKAEGKSATCKVMVEATPVSSITLDKTSITLKTGETATLSATVNPSDATDKTVSWSTSDASIATVKDGVITAVKVGSATITAKAGDKSATCQVTVEATPVSSITLDKTSVTLKAGETATLSATVSPADATDKTVTWSTSDASIATVKDGVVTAVKVGSTTITAKAGDKSATCQVSVEATPVSSITLDMTSVTLKAGETATISATVNPSDATDKTISWTTSDASIATIKDGVITAVKVGSATITAKAGDKSAACQVSVEATPVSSITLDMTSVTLKAGETATISATVNPSDATDKTISWTTSDASVATVKDGVVTAVKVGSTTITAAARDKRATCEVTVEATPVSSITLDKTSVILKAGETATLSATVNPADATDKTVTWTTSDASVATVKDGVVTAVKVGSATITAKAGGKSATCQVTVEATPVSSITLDKTSITLKTGETATLSATVNPADATDKTVTWTTSDASIATIKDGVVTAVKVGSATIAATAGDKSATCQVTVEATPVSSITLDMTSVTLKAGETATLSATVSPTDATDKTITWSTSDASIATVKDGLVTGVKVGSATITATAGDKSAICKVSVEATPVSSITLDKTSLTLKAGETATLSATVSPTDATDKTVSWSTYDASVATVKDGLVTANRIGNTTITAKAGDMYATCQITVEATPVSSITLDKTSVTLKAGETATLSATVNPANATDKHIYWTTSDATIATVKDGVVTAYSVGNATITAYAGDKSTTCQVTVEATPVSSITLDKTSVILKAGETATLSATVNPANATDKNITWTTSDASIATVNDGIVTAYRIGSTTITAKAGDKSATCKITVEATPVSSITLDKTSVTLKAGETATLSATVNPADATDKTVSWTTSDASIATVKDGVVTAVGSGSAIITATAGDKSASCTVSVFVPVTSVSLDKSEVTLSVGSTATLVATVHPANASNKELSWTSSDASIVTVDKGIIKAIKAGKCTVTVTTVDGKFKASCAIKVKGDGLDPGVGDWESGDEHGGNAE